MTLLQRPSIPSLFLTVFIFPRHHRVCRVQPGAVPVHEPVAPELLQPCGLFQFILLTKPTMAVMEAGNGLSRRLTWHGEIAAGMRVHITMLRQRL
jgi:hypothetical protein